MKIKITLAIIAIFSFFITTNCYSKFFFTYSSDQIDQIASIEVDSYDNPVVFLSTGSGAALDSSGNVTIDNSMQSASALVKYNPEGGILWYKTYYFPGLTVYPESVAIDGFDNVYAAGYFISGLSETNVSFGAGADWKTKSQYSAFVVKYDDKGNLLWSKVLSADGIDKAITILDIKADFDGNLLITGALNSGAEFNPGGDSKKTSINNGYGVFLAKYDADGNCIFAYPYETNDVDLDNVSASVAFDETDGFLFAGNFEGQTVFSQTGNATRTSSGQTDIFLARFNSSNILDWVTSFGGPDTDFLSQGGLDYTFFGDILLSGYFGGNSNFDPQGSKVLSSPPGYFAGFVSSFNNFGQFNSVDMYYSNSGNAYVSAARGNFLGDNIISGFFRGELKKNENDGLDLKAVSVNNGYDAFLLDYTEFDSFGFSKNFGTSQISDDNFPIRNSIKALGIDSKNNIFAGGSYYSNKISLFDSIITDQKIGNGFIVKTDVDGNLWKPKTGPAAPQLIYPENNATEIDTSVTFEWNKVEGAVKYRIKLSKVDDPNNLIINDSTGQTSYKKDELDFQTNYIWNVTSADEDGLGSKSPSFKFITKKIVDVNDLIPSNDFAYMSSDGINIHCDNSPYQVMVYNIAGQLLYSRDQVYSSSYNIPPDQKFCNKALIIRLRSTKGDKIFKLMNE